MRERIFIIHSIHRNTPRKGVEPHFIGRRYIILVQRNGTKVRSGRTKRMNPTCRGSREIHAPTPAG